MEGLNDTFSFRDQFLVEFLSGTEANKFDTFDGTKPRFLNRGKKRRSVSTLSIPWASDRGVEWVDFLPWKMV